MKQPATLRRPGAIAASLVAIALLAGGMPLSVGVVMHGPEATFSLDICHPVQSLGHSPLPVSAIARAAEAEESLPQSGQLKEAPAPIRTRAADAPDPPPPKPLA